MIARATIRTGSGIGRTSEFHTLRQGPMHAQTDHPAAMTEIEACLAEAAAILLRAEQTEADLIRRRACEGHRLMAARILRALHRLDGTLRRARDDLAAAAPVERRDRPAAPPHWWVRWLPHRAAPRPAAGPTRIPARRGSRARHEARATQG